MERDGQEITLPSKTNFSLKQGDRLIIETAGGGGFGDPRNRDPKQVSRELQLGLITKQQALQHQATGET